MYYGYKYFITTVVMITTVLSLIYACKCFIISAVLLAAAAAAGRRRDARRKPLYLGEGGQYVTAPRYQRTTNTRIVHNFHYNFVLHDLVV